MNEKIKIPIGIHSNQINIIAINIKNLNKTAIVLNNTFLRKILLFISIVGSHHRNTLMKKRFSIGNTSLFENKLIRLTRRFPYYSFSSQT